MSEGARVSRHDMDACNICQWYSLFKKHTIPSVILPLPSDFLSYLMEDGLYLPSSHCTVDMLSSCDDYDLSEMKKSLNDDDIHTNRVSFNSSESSVTLTREFPDLEGKINTVIKDFKGQVFVKTNWSAPTDASWINAGTCKCISFHEILMLIKSSDKIMYDLEHIYDECIDDEPISEPSVENTTLNHKSNLLVMENQSKLRSLVIKKWVNIEPAYEFRLFIKDSKLRGQIQ